MVAPRPVILMVAQRPEDLLLPVILMVAQRPEDLLLPVILMVAPRPEDLLFPSSRPTSLCAVHPKLGVELLAGTW